MLTQIGDENVDGTFKQYNDDTENIVWTALNPSIATVSSTEEVAAVSKGGILINSRYNSGTSTIYASVA